MSSPLPRLEPTRAPHRFGETTQETSRALGDLALANRLFGGARSMLAPLRGLFGEPRAPVRILDVGCGGADIALAIVDCARAAGLPVRIVAVGDHPEALRLAALASGGTPEVSLVRADARRLPFAPRSFEIVVASMLVHYFALDEAARVLQEWAALASRAVVVSDVERHRVPYLAARALGAVSRRSLFGEGSQRTILRGFTREEFEALAVAAGLRSVIVRRHFPFRLSLVGRIV